MVIFESATEIDHEALGANGIVDSFEPIETQLIILKDPGSDDDV
jgi:hypothetical protein